jgi:putative transposase
MRLNYVYRIAPDSNQIDLLIASAQEICNRGIETYRGNPEKQEIVSQVVLSGNFVLDKWRFRGEMPN